MDFNIVFRKETPTLKAARVKKFVLTFKSFEDLVRCALYLKALNFSRLYRWEKGYRLIISCKETPPFLIIKEFCATIKTGSTELSLTEEYGKFIYGNDAVERINKAFNKLK